MATWGWAYMLGVKTHLSFLGNPVGAAAKGHERYSEEQLPIPVEQSLSAKVAEVKDQRSVDLPGVVARHLFDLCLLSTFTSRAVYPIGLKA